MVSLCYRLFVFGAQAVGKLKARDIWVGSTNLICTRLECKQRLGPTRCLGRLRCFRCLFFRSLPGAAYVFSYAHTPTEKSTDEAFFGCLPHNPTHEGGVVTLTALRKVRGEPFLAPLYGFRNRFRTGLDCDIRHNATQTLLGDILYCRLTDQFA